MDLNKVTPRHEKEHDVVGTGKRPAPDEQHKEQTINAVPPWMRILITRPPNSPQAIRRKTSPYRRTRMKQEVEAILARQQDIVGLELNEQGVKPSTGSGDPEEEIETAQLAVLIQRACVAGSAALIQGDFPATQRFFLTCYHAA
ncbi:MAG: hypothetical protein EZS28_034635 [Streblomastix strix]|uniref:Uncharacterized protein n=1 Tax=Streblomastix strix TaxID=222440 RepID=A0A5J4UIM1_9EUKA|nr:MAG: hypothetical protein EZS28_034635 [Streblomastix strix]